MDGCTDPVATNYDNTAVSHIQNYCVYSVDGCADSTSLTFNALATTHVASDCTYSVYGCTSVSASWTLTRRRFVSSSLGVYWRRWRRRWAYWLDK